MTVRSGDLSAADIHRITEAALAHLELDELLDVLLERIREILDVDTVAILLLEEGDMLRARAAKGLEEEVTQHFSVRVGAGFAGRIAQERRPVVIDDLEPGQAVNPILYQEGLRSVLGVPLVADGTLVGVLHVGSQVPRRFGDDDIGLLEVAADRAALAIEHARLFERERAARAQAEQAIERLEHLQAVTEAGLAYLDLDDLLSVLLERIVAILRADTSAILLLEEDDHTLAARAAKGLEEEVERGFKLPVGTGFAGRVAAERRPVKIPDVVPGAVVNPLMFEKGVRSLLGVPLIVERRLIGVLHVGTLTPRDFTDEDVELLQLVADRAALAIEHDRLFEQYKIAETLQRALLPRPMHAPGVAVSGRYLPAPHASAVGGDWYDVVPLPDGRVGVTIGDVVGHGPNAATLMGSLRSGLRAYAIDGLAPAEVGARMARYTQSLGESRLATYVYGVVDPTHDRFTFVNASHPRPLLVQPDGTAAYVDAPLLPPLGVALTTAVEETTLEFPPGSTLLLYTDGLIERRGVRLAGRQEELLAAARSAPFDPELLCTDVIDKLLGNGHTGTDDVALLGVQRVPAGDQALTVTVAARAEELAAVRRLLRAWLADAGADSATISACVLASGEAASNAMEHAYGPLDATFDLGAEVDGDDVVLTVRDHGHWRPPRGVNRGRGLRLMESFMDEVEVIPGDEGTTVRLRKRLRKRLRED